MSWNKELIHGGYYWLRILDGNNSIEYRGKGGSDLVIGQCRVTFHTMRDFVPKEIQFDICGDDMSFPIDCFEILGLVEEYKER